MGIKFVQIFCHYWVPKFKDRVAKDERDILHFGGIDGATLNCSCHLDLVASSYRNKGNKR